jgi:hypothetical protein
VGANPVPPPHPGYHVQFDSLEAQDYDLDIPVLLCVYEYSG